MNLSTSNSRFLVSLMLGVTLLVVYNIILVYSSPATTKFPNQWIENYSLAERYIYLEEVPEVVIVGSSMAARLNEKTVHHEARNISFVSAGATTGLAVIERSELYPKLLFIESNTISNKIESEMIDSLFTPILWKIKRYFRFLQYQYQSGIYFISSITGGAEKFARVNRKVKISEDILRKRVQIILESHADVTIISNADFLELKETLSNIASKGTKIVFFRMPVAPELVDSAFYKLTDEILASEFSEYPNISMTADMASNYQTTDGLHLEPFSARAFSVNLSMHVTSFLR